MSGRSDDGYVSRLVGAARSRGLRSCAESLGDVAEDWLFERRNGLTTHEPQQLADLEIESDNLEFGTRYHPVRVGHVRRVLQRLPISPSTHHFVDFGCGKGRVLFVAASLGFRHVTGVDFAAELAEVANANNDAFARRHNGRTPVEVVHGDAIALPLSAEPTVYYAYNPFDATVLGPVLDNIMRARATATTSSWLVYTNALEAAIVDALPGTERRFSMSWGGERSEVWELMPSPEAGTGHDALP